MSPRCPVALIPPPASWLSEDWRAAGPSRRISGDSRVMEPGAPMIENADAPGRPPAEAPANASMELPPEAPAEAPHVVPLARQISHSQPPRVLAIANQKG